MSCRTKAHGEETRGGRSVSGLIEASIVPGWKARRLMVSLEGARARARGSPAGLEGASAVGRRNSGGRALVAVHHRLDAAGSGAAGDASRGERPGR